MMSLLNSIDEKGYSDILKSMLSIEEFIKDKYETKIVIDW